MIDLDVGALTLFISVGTGSIGGLLRIQTIYQGSKHTRVTQGTE